MKKKRYRTINPYFVTQWLLDQILWRVGFVVRLPALEIKYVPPGNMTLQLHTTLTTWCQQLSNTATWPPFSMTNQKAAPKRVMCNRAACNSVTSGSETLCYLCYLFAAYPSPPLPSRPWVWIKSILINRSNSMMLLRFEQLRIIRIDLRLSYCNKPSKTLRRASGLKEGALRLRIHMLNGCKKAWAGAQYVCA